MTEFEIYQHPSDGESFQVATVTASIDVQSGFLCGTDAIKHMLEEEPDMKQPGVTYSVEYTYFGEFDREFYTV